MASWRLAAVGLCIALVGCGSGSPPPDAEPVVVFGSKWYGQLPTLLAIESGIFQDHGFSVTYREVVKSSDRMAALGSGRVHFGSVGQIAMLTALAHGNDSFYWVGCPDMAYGFEGLVGGTGVSSFQDLRGKRIGVPFASSAEVTARLLLEENGIGPNDVELINLDPASIPSAVASGAVAAGCIWESYFGELKAVDGATVLGLDTDTIVYRQFGTMSGLDVLLVNKAWADANPQRAQRLLDAYWEAMDQVKRDPVAALDVVYASHFTQDRGEMDSNLEKFVWLDRAGQQEMMSDERLFAHTDYLLKILERIGHINEIPDFRSHTNLAIALGNP